jgi:diacylglycerol kinase family enzyme
MKLTITSDSKRRIIRTPLLFVARNATQLEEFHVPGVQCVTQGGFAVYALRAASKLELLRVAWRALTGKLEPQHDFDLFCTSELRVESRRMLRTLAFDGERVKMLAPLDFQVGKAALNILVSKRREEIAV